MIIPLYEICEENRHLVGGKAFALAELSRKGFPVPDAVVVPVGVYNDFVTVTGLRERILLELNRKEFADMRWEELWDASLRIRSMFLKKPIVPGLAAVLTESIESFCKDAPVVVRSSAPGEDSSRTSFAGLHESFVNIRGTEAIIEHVKMVWASLWSDAALLYRRELKLDVARSSMAVVIQKIVRSDCSGVAFSKKPNDESYLVIESVYGLNQGLVDGTVEPDRWTLLRSSGSVISHEAARREVRLAPSESGVHLMNLEDGLSKTPPLNGDQVHAVFDLTMRSEKYFGVPQDVEWTFEKGALYLLQSRPITTLVEEASGNTRAWYLSLRRSFENLQGLRRRIEGELIPGMVREAERLAEGKVESLADVELADEIEQRRRIHSRWVDVYWADFIPFAHGFRLFGQVYNDTIRPDDPYEFTVLLGATPMISLERNARLEAMASLIATDERLRAALERRAFDAIGDPFAALLARYRTDFGSVHGAAAADRDGRRLLEEITPLLLEMARRPEGRRKGRAPSEAQKLTAAFMANFKDRERETVTGLLDLARASYRLRDDDNIYLGRIEAEYERALAEGRKRLGRRQGGFPDMPADDVPGSLKDPHYRPSTAPSGDRTGSPFAGTRARQLIGQPAGPGLCHGIARVIESRAELSRFRNDEILVCDAVDPNMTFVVPLAAGIVERRGGMLIHGAIIAREYGLPCVTGVPDATGSIRTGDILTVDGYLGIVTIES